MKSFTLDLLHSDEEVHYRDCFINEHKFAFDQIQYNKGGLHNMERIAVPVIRKSDGKPVANLETTVILVECGNIYHYLDNGFAVRLSDAQMVTVANEILKKRAEVRGTGLKTLSGWRESGLPSVEDYLEVGDEVDGEMLDYFLNVLPPRTNRAGLLQVGGEISTVKNIDGGWLPTHLTFKQQGGTWRYAGRCFAGSAEPVQKYQSSLERMMLTRCKLPGCIVQEVEV